MKAGSSEEKELRSVFVPSLQLYRRYSGSALLPPNILFFLVKDYVVARILFTISSFELITNMSLSFNDSSFHVILALCLLSLLETLISNVSN